MSHVIIIRDYKLTDFAIVSEVVRNAYLTNVWRTWCNALTREITFQLIVMSAAVLFIFMGIPLTYCIFAIPLVLFLTYVVIYGSFLIKSAELMHSKKPLHCWVAEACEPFIFLQQPEQVSYRIILESRANAEGFDMGNYRRKVIGTIAVSRHLHLENSAWLFRLGVDKRYMRTLKLYLTCSCRYGHKGVAHTLIHTVKDWCRLQGYNSLELAMSECQDVARQLFVDTGFEMKQLYHKQLIGNAVTLLMYQLGSDLRQTRPNL